MANYCPSNLRELQATARNKRKIAPKRLSIIAACRNALALSALAPSRRLTD
jgi:hypothetical protein